MVESVKNHMRNKHKIVVGGETSTDLKPISWVIDKGLHARFALGNVLQIVICHGDFCHHFFLKSHA